jgi:Ca2+/H+ antiporter, TMEM165/GDT1 family
VAAFLASLVEFVEALTVVSAVGTVRGWRGALTGSAGALGVLLLLVILLGSAFTRVPLHIVQLAVGTLLLLFGLQWLRKAILCSAGIIPLHDEAAAYAKETATLRQATPASRGCNTIAITTASKITMLEGIQVVFIVIAVGAGGVGLPVPACAGAVGGLLLVVALGVVVHKPLSAIPEHILKFVVSVLLTAFGTFGSARVSASNGPARTGLSSR